MRITPDQISGYANQFFNNKVMAMMLTWLGYIVISALIIGALVSVYFAIQFKFKVWYPKLHYSPDGKSAQIIGWKKDRARTTRRKDGKVEQHILFCNARIEKFREEDILPGNRVIIFKIDKDSKTYIPMPTIEFEDHIARFSTLTPEEKHWIILQLKENANTYADLDAQKRILTYTIVAVILILVAICFCTWLMMKQPMRMVDATNGLTQAFQNIAENLGGKPPG